MTCPCDSPGPAPEPELNVFSASNPLDVLDPPEPTSSGPVSVPILDGCTINTSGVHDINHFPGITLKYIFASVSGGPEVAGYVNGTSWNVPNVPGAKWTPAGLAQFVHVRGLFVDNNGLAIPFETNRDFLGTSGPSYCQYYAEAAPAPASLPHRTITEVIPRYFKVTAEFAGQSSFGPLAGGLLSPASIFLAYDPNTSTPECACWRDMGLPPSVGSWLLRVYQTCNGYEALLSIQMSTETCIQPATIFVTRSWNFRKRNMLHGSMEIGMCTQEVTLLVEPS